MLLLFAGGGGGAASVKRGDESRNGNGCKTVLPVEKNEEMETDGRDRDGSDTEGMLLLRLLNENTDVWSFPISDSGARF